MASASCTTRTSLVTRHTVPGIQLREYRAEVNGAKAGLHGEASRSLPLSSTAGLTQRPYSYAQAHLEDLRPRRRPNIP